MEKRNIRATLVIGVIGLVIGIALVAAGKKFYVAVDKKAIAVRECLPGNNCGACGYAGCDAVAAAIAAGMVLLTILSAAMSAGKVPIWAVKGIGLILGCLLACIGAFFCARHAKQNGFFLGMLCAGILFAAGMLGSLAIGETPGFWALVKLFSMLLCGCLCGSIGVNLKQRKKGF